MQRKRKDKSKIEAWIPIVGLALVMVGVCSLASGNKCYATPSASLTIGSAGGTSESLSTTAVQGSTTYLSSTITATTTDTESYTLTINGPVGLSGGSNISGANNSKPSAMPNNSWGYAYNDSNSNENKTYKSFTGSNQELEKGTVASGIAKNITFAAKFAGDAAAGRYTAEVNVNLAATPKDTTAKWSNGTNSGIEYMQDIVKAIDGFCSDSLPTHASIILKDNRDQSTYKIVKMADGRCWMTEDLRLYGNRALTSVDSDVKSNYSLPASNIENFSTNNSIQATYIEGETGYYSWCAATANSCTEATSSGAEASSSICPKNWKLPSGGTSGEFHTFTDAEGIADSSTGSTKLQGSPYDFTFSGRVDITTLKKRCWLLVVAHGKWR